MARWFPGRSDAEQLQTRFEAGDGRVGPAGLLPLFAGNPVAVRDQDLAVIEVPLDPVRLVTELAADRPGRRVVLERRGQRVGRAKASEGQVQHGCAHLDAEPVSLILDTEP